MNKITLSILVIFSALLVLLIMIPESFWDYVENKEGVDPKIFYGFMVSGGVFLVIMIILARKMLQEKDDYSKEREAYLKLLKEDTEDGK